MKGVKWQVKDGFGVRCVTASGGIINYGTLYGHLKGPGASSDTAF